MNSGYGILLMSSIEGAFNLLQAASHTEIELRPVWNYTNWSLALDGNFMDQIQTLNVDCLLRIFKFLRTADLICISKHNQHFSNVVSKSLKIWRVEDEIGILNFAYVMHLYGRSIRMLTIYIDSFARVFGTHTFQTKLIIIYLI